MTDQFTYRHARADLVFTWDGGCQIKIRAGRTCPGWSVVPDRFDIREPELWRTDLLPEAERPKFPRDFDVVMVPATQEAFEEVCNAWWEGRDIPTGRDFARNPMLIKGMSGHSLCAFDVRYTGGASIEASPAGLGDWRPIVDLAADGHTASDVTATWLMGRVDGWIIGVFERLGVVTPQGAPDPTRYGWDSHDQIMRWTTGHLPAMVSASNPSAAWRTWFHSQVRDLWALPDGPEAWRNAGIPVQYVSNCRPLTYERETADGMRWNFVWCGQPYAYVYSPDSDRPVAIEADCRFLERPGDAADGPVLAWFKQQADAWIAARDAQPGTRP